MQYMKKIFIVFLLACFSFSCAAGLSQQRSKMIFWFLEKWDQRIGSMEAQTRWNYLSGVIQSFDQYRSRVRSDQTKEIIDLLLSYACIKRQSIDGTLCSDRFFPDTTLTGDTDVYMSEQNKIRASYGLSKLTQNSELTKVAQSYADTLCSTKHFSHTGLDGSTIASRIQKSDYTYALIGENLAFGYTDSIKTALQLWTSPDHRQNVLHPDFEDVWVGYCEKYWVVMYGTSR